MFYPRGFGFMSRAKIFTANSLMRAAIVIAVIMMTVTSACASGFFGPDLLASHVFGSVCENGCNEDTMNPVIGHGAENSPYADGMSSPYALEVISPNGVQAGIVTQRDRYNKSSRSLTSDSASVLVFSEPSMDSASMGSSDNGAHTYSSGICIKTTHRRE